MTSRLWVVGIYLFYIIGALVCVILDQLIFNNGHHPITNNFLPLIFLFGFLYCIFDAEGFEKVDAMSGVFWVLIVFSWTGPFYMLARLVGFQRLNVRTW